MHWVSGTGRPIVGPDGEVVAMVGVGADITEQHAAYEATLAAEAATAIAQDAAARSQARLALLGRVSGVLGASLDVSTTLQQLADIVVHEGLGDWCAVEVPGGPHGVRRLALAHRDPAMVEFARRMQEDYPPQLRDDQGVGKVLLTGEPELWPSIPPELIRQSAVDETHLELIESLQISAGIVVPLTARGRVLGVLSLVGSGGRTFDEEDMAAAMELGARAGVALDNAYLYDDRDTVARTLQQSLLPHTLPDVPGLDLAATYRPGSITLGIGGDFYDVFPAGEGSWRLVIGDVCGKGVEAAALTGAVRYALRTAAVLTPSPAAALAIVNDTLLREDWQHRFATLTLLAVDLSEGSIRVTAASGGHPPPLLRTADGTVTRVEAPGTIVGTLPDAQFTETIVRAGRGGLPLPLHRRHRGGGRARRDVRRRPVDRSAGVRGQQLGIGRHRPDAGRAGRVRRAIRRAPPRRRGSRRLGPAHGPGPLTHRPCQRPRQPPVKTRAASARCSGD